LRDHTVLLSDIGNTFIYLTSGRKLDTDGTVISLSKIGQY